MFSLFWFSFSRFAFAGATRSGQGARLAPALLALALFFAPLPALADGKGRASWYGTSADGKPTANGEIHNRLALTAAHMEYPFGTVVRVYNLRNGRHVLVRVNDRGPFVKGRVMDVSRRAAEALKMTSSGVVSVAFEVVSNQKGEPLNGKSGFFVHLGNESNVFMGKARVAELEKNLRLPVRTMASTQGKRPGYALCAGPYKSFGAAQRVFLRLEKNKVPVLGIIEGPADGGDLPRLSPPGRKRAARKEAASAARPSGPPSQDLSALDNGALLRALLKNMLPGLTGCSDLFLLPSSSLSGYLLSSSL